MKPIITFLIIFLTLPLLSEEKIKEFFVKKPAQESSEQKESPKTENIKEFFVKKEVSEVETKESPEEEQNHIKDFFLKK